MIDLQITARLPRRLGLFATKMEAGLRGAMHRKVGVALLDLTQRHIAKIAEEKHATADRLGAERTGFYEDAAQRVSVSVRGGNLRLDVNHPGFARAFHDVTITPHGNYPLTIPIHAIAYGYRAGELRARGYDLFRPLKKGAKATGTKLSVTGRRVAVFDPSQRMNILAARAGSGLLKLYALCVSVTQKQDRTLFPSDEEFQETGTKAARQYLRELKEDTRE